MRVHHTLKYRHWFTIHQNLRASRQALTGLINDTDKNLRNLLGDPLYSVEDQAGVQ